MGFSGGSVVKNMLLKTKKKKKDIGVEKPEIARGKSFLTLGSGVQCGVGVWRPLGVRL